MTLLAPLTLNELISVEYPSNVVIGSEVLDVGGLMLVVGPTSVGKSYFLLQLAMNIATGTPVLGQWSVPRPFVVYLVQAEIGRKRFQSRVEKLWRNFPQSPQPKLWLETTYDLKLDTPGGLAALEAVVARLGVEVLVLDPLRPFHSRDENSSQEMQRLFDSFLKIQLKHDVAIIFGHHDRKPSAEGRGRSIYEARGNTIITDRPDTVFRLKPQKGGLTVVAVCEKLRNADSLLPSQIWVGDRTTGLFHQIHDSPTTSRSDVMRMLLKDGGRPLGELAVVLAETTGITLKAAYRAIDRLEQSNVLVKAPSNAGHNEKIVTLVGG